MKLIKHFILGILIASSLAISTARGADNVLSDVTNYSPMVNTQLWVLPFPGTTTSSSSATLISSFVVPSKYNILAVKARAETLDTGTVTNRLYIAIEEALAGTTTDTTILSSNLAIGTASSSVVGTISDSSIADESLINIYAYGSSCTNITLMMYVERTN